VHIIKNPRLRVPIAAFIVGNGTTAAVVGVMVATALRDPIWPFLLFVGIGAASFVVGLAMFRDGSPGDSAQLPR
jgi:hypothetical protein